MNNNIEPHKYYFHFRQKFPDFELETTETDTVHADDMKEAIGVLHMRHAFLTDYFLIAVDGEEPSI